MVQHPTAVRVMQDIASAAEQLMEGIRCQSVAPDHSYQQYYGMTFSGIKFWTYQPSWHTLAVGDGGRGQQAERGVAGEGMQGESWACVQAGEEGTGGK